MPDPAPEREDAIDAAVLLEVLAQVKGGDFSARMPLAWTGVAGKVADGFNEVIIANQVLGAELARVSEVVGKQGKLSQRVVLGSASQSWAGSIESVNNLIDDLVRPTIEMQRVIGAVADGDLEQEDVRRGRRRDARAEEHDQRHGRPAQRVRLRGDARRPRGRHRGQARPGRCGHDRGRRRLEGPDRQRQPHGRQPDRPGAQHRRGDHRGRQRRPQQEDLDRRQGRVPRAEEHGQRDGRPAQRVRRRGDARRARGRGRGQARRPGAVDRGQRCLEGPDRQRQPARRQPDQPGARDRRGGHRGHRGRSHAAGLASRPAARSPSSRTRSTR